MGELLLDLGQHALEEVEKIYDQILQISPDKIRLGDVRCLASRYAFFHYWYYNYSSDLGLTMFDNLDICQYHARKWDWALRELEVGNWNTLKHELQIEGRDFKAGEDEEMERVGNNLLLISSLLA